MTGKRALNRVKAKCIRLHIDSAKTEGNGTQGWGRFANNRCQSVSFWRYHNEIEHSQCDNTFEQVTAETTSHCCIIYVPHVAIIFRHCALCCVLILIGVTTTVQSDTSVNSCMCERFYSYLLMMLPIHQITGSDFFRLCIVVT